MDMKQSKRKNIRQERKKVGFHIKSYSYVVSFFRILLACDSIMRMYCEMPSFLWVTLSQMILDFK